MGKLLIICPAYNEAKKLPKLINEFKQTKYLEDLYVVNSGSKDESEKILIENNIRHTSLPENKGGGHAIITGIKYAIKNEYKICCIIAGNGKMDPREVTKLIEKMLSST